MVDCAEAGDYAGGEQEVWFRLDSQRVLVTPGAARLRDQLCAAQLDDEASVLQANVEFYVA